MATTLTPNKNLNVIGITDTGWGPPTNDNVDVLDKALGGAIGISAVSGTTVMTIDDLQNMTLVFTGSLGANAIYQVPTGVSGQWVVSNNTTGDYTLTIASQAGGTTVTIPQSTVGTVYVNTSVVSGAIRADTPFTSASSDTQVIYNSSGNLIGSDTLNYSLSSGFSAGVEDATTNTVVPAAVFTRQSSGVPAVGIGVSAIFNVESSSGRVVTSGEASYVCSSNSVGAESFDYVLNLMASGVTSQKFRVNSDGSVGANSVYGGWVASSAEAIAGTSNTKIMTPVKSTENVKSNLNATGSAPMFACRGWVNFNGTSGAIRASGNVSSVTRIGTGRYRINFTTAMPDANYCMTSATNSYGSSDPGGNINVKIETSSITGAPSNMTTTSVDVICGAGALTDASYICISFFR